MAFLRNETTGEIIATRVERAGTWFERAVGLLFRPRVRSDEGVWIESCSAIHTIGMRAPIDIIFVDAANRVVRLCPEVRSWRWAVVCWKARSVIELGSGAIKDVDVMTGDQLTLC